MYIIKLFKENNIQYNLTNNVGKTFHSQFYCKSSTQFKSGHPDPIHKLYFIVFFFIHWVCCQQTTNINTVTRWLRKRNINNWFLRHSSNDAFICKMEINNYLQTLHTIIDMYKLLMNIKYNLQSNLIFIEDVFTSIYHTISFGMI